MTTDRMDDRDVTGRKPLDPACDICGFMTCRVDHGCCIKGVFATAFYPQLKTTTIHVDPQHPAMGNQQPTCGFQVCNKGQHQFMDIDDPGRG